MRERSHKYINEHNGEIKDRQKKYYEKNSKVLNEKSRNYYREHIDEIKEQKKKYNKENESVSISLHPNIPIKKDQQTKL